MATEEVIEIAKKYLKVLDDEGIAIHKAFLYGSYLNGTSTQESDIDLLIVTDKVADDTRVGKIWNLTRRVNSRIEPYVINAERFYGASASPLVDMVKIAGLEINVV